MLVELTLFFSFLFFLCFSLIFPFSFFLSFLLLLVSISWFPSSQFYPPSSPYIVFFFSLYTARAPFYSACREQILLFQPLTAFVWFGSTCRPPHLCAALHHQTKRTILFVSLLWHPFLATVWVPSLSLSLMTCTQ